MANFTAKERVLASILSATPGLKKVAKNSYIKLNAVLYKKDYRYKIFSNQIIGEIKEVIPNEDKEYYGGYYDNPLINTKNLALSHLSNTSTLGLPSGNIPNSIILTDLKKNKHVKIDNTCAYNWQQGARTYIRQIN